MCLTARTVWDVKQVTETQQCLCSALTAKHDKVRWFCVWHVFPAVRFMADVTSLNTLSSCVGSTAYNFDFSYFVWALFSFFCFVAENNLGKCRKTSLCTGVVLLSVCLSVVALWFSSTA